MSENLYDLAADINSSIKIFGAPNNLNKAECPMIDEIDADEHETFTLEEMKALILSYRKKNLDFIIARVTTPDPENSANFYNFYYAAPEINRILFRFESSRRLLHRMKVKNPLNNMFIIGQVFYYKITMENIDRGIVDYFFGKEENIGRRRQAMSAIYRPVGNSSEKCVTPVKSKDELDIQSNTDRCYKEIINSVAAGRTKVPKNVPKSRKIKYYAHYFASDDDFLLKQEVRDYFKQNAYDPEDDFLYEIDRTQNDFLALLDEESSEGDEDISEWRRIFSAHLSLALTLLGACLLFGIGPQMAVILFFISIFIFLSFMCSLSYMLCCRRSTFDTMAVNSIEEEL